MGESDRWVAVKCATQLDSKVQINYSFMKAHSDEHLVGVTLYVFLMACVMKTVS